MVFLSVLAFFSSNTPGSGVLFLERLRLASFLVIFTWPVDELYTDRNTVESKMKKIEYLLDICREALMNGQPVSHPKGWIRSLPGKDMKGRNAIEKHLKELEVFFNEIGEDNLEARSIDNRGVSIVNKNPDTADDRNEELKFQGLITR
jgi:hypothetical protein